MRVLQGLVLAVTLVWPGHLWELSGLMLQRPAWSCVCMVMSLRRPRSSAPRAIPAVAHASAYLRIVAQRAGLVRWRLYP